MNAIYRRVREAVRGVKPSASQTDFDLADVVSAVWEDVLRPFLDHEPIGIIRDEAYSTCLYCGSDQSYEDHPLGGTIFYVLQHEDDCPWYKTTVDLGCPTPDEEWVHDDVCPCYDCEGPKAAPRFEPYSLPIPNIYQDEVVMGIMRALVDADPYADVNDCGYNTCIYCFEDEQDRPEGWEKDPDWEPIINHTESCVWRRAKETLDARRLRRVAIIRGQS